MHDRYDDEFAAQPPLTRSGLRVAAIAMAIGALVGLLAAFVFGVVRYFEPIPAIAPATSFEPSSESIALPGSFPWPGHGQAAIAVDGLGVVATHGVNAGPQPIASTTKVMTALLILEDHPLKPGESGPTLTLTQADADRYAQVVAQDQSSIEVQAGEKITERQLLEGLLLPSANNFAEILAAWDAGSEAAFVAKMNARAKQLGMNSTHFADSSGFSPQSVSTATDMLALAQVAMRDAAFAAIVAMPDTTLPVVGKVTNSNELLGKDGVVGIKTGSTDQAGGCLITAADIVDSAGVKHRVYTVVLGTKEQVDSLKNVFPATQAMLAAIPRWLVSKKVVSRGQVVATYSAPWGGTVDAVASQDLIVTNWAGSNVTTHLSLNNINAPIGETSKVGDISVQSGGRTQHVDVVTASGLEGPGLGWRLSRD